MKIEFNILRTLFILLFYSTFAFNQNANTITLSKSDSGNKVYKAQNEIFFNTGYV